MEDAGILELFLARSEEAVKQTEKKYAGYCYSVAYGILGNNEDAEECVNEAILKAWDSIPPNNPENLKLYLGRIARNLSINRLKAETSQKRGAGIGYVSFSAVDAEGNPTSFIPYEVTSQNGVPTRVSLGDPDLTSHIWTESYKLGNDEVHFIKLYVSSCYGNMGEPTLYWQLCDDKELYGSPILFTVVDKNTWDRIVDEIAQLDKESLLKIEYSPEKDEVIYGGSNYNAVIPEVLNILKKYDLVELDYEAMPSQVIETENCTFIFGRTDGILKYNSEEFNVDSFVIKRESGEEIKVERYFKDFNLWKISDMDNMRWFPNTSSGSGENDYVACYNYGFILGVDEKVSVIINGETYK